MPPERSALPRSARRFSKRRVFLWIATTAAVVVTLSFLTPMLVARYDARTQFNRGTEALNRGEYPLAAMHFQSAIRLRPGLHDARLNLAIAYARQFVPGGGSPEKLELARQAYDELEHVLRNDPGNRVAVAWLGSLSYEQGKEEEARQWYEKLAAIDSGNANAYAMLATLAWRRMYPAFLEARQLAGMKPEDPGPIVSAESRSRLEAAWSREIGVALENASKALAIDPQHVTAMTTLAMLHRVRGDLAATADRHRRELQSASSWMRRALEARRLAAQRSPAATPAVDVTQP
jgi:tetratricopeptide (TPR) repeat protein